MTVRSRERCQRFVLPELRIVAEHHAWSSRVAAPAPRASMSPARGVPSIPKPDREKVARVPYRRRSGVPPSVRVRQADGRDPRRHRAKQILHDVTEKAVAVPAKTHLQYVGSCWSPIGRKRANARIGLSCQGMRAACDGQQPSLSLSEEGGNYCQFHSRISTKWPAIAAAAAIAGETRCVRPLKP